MYFTLLGYLSMSLTAPTGILICTRMLGSLLWCKPMSMNNRCYQPYAHVALSWME